MTAGPGSPLLTIDQLLFSCEHGGNNVPKRYEETLRRAGHLLRTHRGYDPGALPLARRMARAVKAPLIASATTRLLVDLNRSLHHRNAFSDCTRELPAAERDRIVARYYRPHRDRVEHAVADAVRRGRTVLHVGVHSFTPRLNGKVRKADVGLLYDPSRPAERSVSTLWRLLIREIDPTCRIRRNYPYRGNADGLTTYLRRRYSEGYLGIELEINNRLLTERRAGRTADLMVRSLHRLLRKTEASVHRSAV